MEKRFKILIVSQYYYPDVTAAAFRIKEMADILSSKGHEVTVLTAKPHRGVIQASTKIDDASVSVTRLPIILYCRKGKWNYIAHYASFMLTSICYYFLNIRQQFDVVLASSPPLPVGLVGLLISLFRDNKFILDIRDIWPDAVVVAGGLRKESKIFRLGKKLEYWLYSKADEIICVSRPMAEYIKSIVPRKNVAVIYNGVPIKYLKMENYNNNFNNHILQTGKINISYVGNMGHAQNLQLILEVANKIKLEMPEIVFYLIGEGVERQKLEKVREDNLLDNVVITGPVVKEQAMRLMKESDALFFHLKEDKVLEKTVPSKVFDYMTSGKPILFGIKGEGKEILEQVKSNIYYYPESVASFIEALKRLKENYSELSRYAIANKRLVEKYYTREKMVDLLENHIRHLYQ